MTVPVCPASVESVPVCPDLGGTGLARERNRDMSRCPVPSRSFPSVPCPDAMTVLSRLRMNYRQAGKLMEAKAIENAMSLIREKGKSK